VSPPVRRRSARDPGRDHHLPIGIRSRKRRRQRVRARRRRLVLTFVGLALGLALLLAIGGFGGVAAITAGCNLSSLRPVAIGQNSFVYASDGSLLGAIPAERNREPVRLAHVSPWVPKATVAIEDRRFYEHGGIDPEGILRAVVADLRARRIVQGGSTITQQLVRNLYIGKERTLRRKLVEACLAVKLSQAWSKDRILQAYMNQVYYGNHAYGIEAAAQTYFSRHARGLTLRQSALLAGLPQAPSEFDPFHAPVAALARRNEVLRAILANHDISAAQFRRAVSSRSLGLRPGRLYTRIREPYFFSFVRDRLIAEYGAQAVRSGGLRVYTTIDRRFQRAALASIRKTLDRRGDPAAALVAIDPRTGAIRAMTSVTPGRSGSQFNLVAQARRQAGSTFKTFVLTTAILDGIDPDTTTYVSAPFHYQPDPFTPAWNVATYDRTYLGATTIRNATLRSDNTVYAQLTLDVGPDNVAQTAHRLGITTDLSVHGAFVPSMGLGAIAVSPLELASAYATLAAQGVYSEPMAIRKVVFASGKKDTSSGWGRPHRTRVIPDGVAYEVTKILEDNVLHGTGTGAYFGRSAAGKTGTTDNHADAWFCGYTPNLETTVWVGYPRAEIPMEHVHGIAVAGGIFPATIWKFFMESAIGSSRALDFREPKQLPVWKPFTRGQYAIKPAPPSPPAPPSAPTTSTVATTSAGHGPTLDPAEDQHAVSREDDAPGAILP
jgi:penicillin-binding protein 1A